MQFWVRSTIMHRFAIALSGACAVIIITAAWFFRQDPTEERLRTLDLSPRLDLMASPSQLALESFGDLRAFRGGSSARTNGDLWFVVTIAISLCSNSIYR